MRFFIILFLFFTGSILNAKPIEGDAVSINKSGLTSVSLKSKGLRVQVEFETHIYDGKGPKERCCPNPSKGTSLVDSLKITVNGKSLEMPWGVYCMMQDLKNAYISINEEKADLIIESGVEEEGFKEVITFDSSQVLHTVDYADIAPDQPLEETTYYPDLVIN